MFAIDFSFVALPGALIVMAIAMLATRVLKLIPAGMHFGQLLAMTFGLAAGGAMMGFTIEELVLRPMALQDELVGRQLVTPLALRSYTFWGWMDPGWRWDYAVDQDRAAQLQRRDCRRDRFRPTRCSLGGSLDMAKERSVSLGIEGTTITIEEAYW